MNITAEYKYVYDPTHMNKPDGDWNRTGSGWSKNIGEDTKVTYSSPAKPSSHNDDKKDDLFDQDSDFDTDVEKQQNKPSAQESKENDDLDNIDNDKIEETTENSEEDNSDNSDSENIDEQPKEEIEQSESEQQQQLDDNGEQQQQSDGEDEIVMQEEDTDTEQTEEDTENNDQSEQTDQENTEQTDQNIDSYFNEQNKPIYLDADKYDTYINDMNNFITKFDQDEGKENKVTFKAVASNLDWSNLDDVKAFANHCNKAGIEGCCKIIAFLYFQYNDSKDEFDKILEKMN